MVFLIMKNLTLSELGEKLSETALTLVIDLLILQEKKYWEKFNSKLEQKAREIRERFTLRIVKWCL